MRAGGTGPPRVDSGVSRRGRGGRRGSAAAIPPGTSGTAPRRSAFASDGSAAVRSRTAELPPPTAVPLAAPPPSTVVTIPRCSDSPVTAPSANPTPVPPLPGEEEEMERRRAIAEEREIARLRNNNALLREEIARLQRAVAAREHAATSTQMPLFNFKRLPLDPSCVNSGRTGGSADSGRGPTSRSGGSSVDSARELEELIAAVDEHRARWLAEPRTPSRAQAANDLCARVAEARKESERMRGLRRMQARQMELLQRTFLDKVAGVIDSPNATPASAPLTEQQRGGLATPVGPSQTALCRSSTTQHTGRATGSSGSTQGLSRTTAHEAGGVVSGRSALSDRAAQTPATGSTSLSHRTHPAAPLRTAAAIRTAARYGEVATMPPQQLGSRGRISGSPPRPRPATVAVQ